MSDTLTPSSSLADTGIKFVDIVGKVANIALNIDRTAEQVDAIIGPLAGFIPYYDQVMRVLKIADPILVKINQAAPIAEQAIEAGRPIIDAVQASAPAVMPHLRDLLAVVVSHAPAGAIHDVAGAKADFEGFAQQVLVGRKWTAEEEQRWFDKAVGDR